MPGAVAVIFVLLNLTVMVLSSSPCPPNYVAMNDKCYYFSSSNVSSWQEAVLKCIAIDAQLLSIETEEENFMIEAYVAKKGREITYWTSGSDEKKAGQWKWTTTGEDFTFEGWQAGKSGLGGERCIHIVYKGGYIGWNNAPCDQKVHYGFLPSHYICERSTISPKELANCGCKNKEDITRKLDSQVPCSNTSTETKASQIKLCPVSFAQLERNCYHFSDTVSNWEEAYNNCKKLNSNLVSIESLSEALVLNDYLVRQTRKVNYWTSASDEVVEGQWTWTSAPKNPIIYTQWCKNQPDNTNKKEHHLHLYHDSDGVCWNDLPGNENEGWGVKVGYICESPMS